MRGRYVQLVALLLIHLTYFCVASNSKCSKYFAVRSLNTTQLSELHRLVGSHFAGLVSENSTKYKEARNERDPKRYMDYVADALLNPPPGSLETVSPLVRELHRRLVKFSENYGEHNVKDRLALFLLKEKSLFDEVGNEVTDTMSPAVARALGGNSIIRRKVREKKLSLTTIRQLTHFMDRFRVDILEFGSGFPTSPKAPEPDPSTERGNVARSKAFGEKGIGYIPR